MGLFDYAERKLHEARRRREGSESAEHTPSPDEAVQEKMVPCPAMKCGAGGGFCGLCGTSEEVTESVAEDYCNWLETRHRPLFNRD